MPLRSRFLSIRVACAWRCVRDRPRFCARTDFYASFDRRTATRFVREYLDRFGCASSLGPIDGVESEVIAQLRIGAGVKQEGDEMRVTEDGGEDQRRLPAAGSFVYVGSVGENSTDGAGIAGRYRLR